MSLKQHFPGLPGKVVLQDLEEVIRDAVENGTVDDGVQTMVHDFFTSQPVKGMLSLPHLLRWQAQEGAQPPCACHLKRIGRASTCSPSLISVLWLGS